jgi:hypothetical protein
MVKSLVVPGALVIPRSPATRNLVLAGPRSSRFLTSFEMTISKGEMTISKGAKDRGENSYGRLISSSRWVGTNINKDIMRVSLWK